MRIVVEVFKELTGLNSISRLVWRYNKLRRRASEAASVTLQFSKYVLLFEGIHFRP